MFEFKIDLNDEDYLQFNYYHASNSPMGKRTLLYYRFQMYILSALCILVFFIARADRLLIFIEAIFLGIVSILWFIFSKRRYFGLIRKRILRMKREGKLPYHTHVILRFEEDEIHESTPEIELRVKYSLVEKIAVTEHGVYIYHSSMHAFLLPNTVFSGEEEKLKFLEFINSKADGLREK